ncbi:MAG TPA: hypothetical protein EYH31_00620, partial [Anaerolineae bacterium]|nr:hypothetical protein [Anaerolineae bacterium]
MTEQTKWRLWGRDSLATLFGDMVIYRSLEPLDPRLPGLKAAWKEMGLPSPDVPRKLQPAYARAATWLLRQARALDAPRVEIEELLFIGDTELNDGNAYRNLVRASHWSAWAFIGRDALKSKPEVRIQPDNLFVANRWSALADWITWVLQSGCHCDERTVVIVDMDKTALGARGRNDGAVDQARVAGVYAAVADTLEERFDKEAFLTAYRTLNQPKFHSFTSDNQ